MQRELSLDLCLCGLECSGVATVTDQAGLSKWCVSQTDIGHQESGQQHHPQQYIRQGYHATPRMSSIDVPNTEVSTTPWISDDFSILSSPVTSRHDFQSMSSPDLFGTPVPTTFPTTPPPPELQSSSIPSPPPPPPPPPPSPQRKSFRIMEDRIHNPCKVFIGGIGQGTVEATIREHFKQYGNILDCMIVTHRRSGKSRGFGFVTYSNEYEAQNVVKEKHKVDDVVVECRRALPRDEARVTAPHDSLYMPTKIFVGGIPESVQEEHFKNYFEKFGEVVDVSLAYDKSNHRPRGFGFVVFASSEAANTAVGRHMFYGKAVEAKHAVPRDPMKGISNRPTKRRMNSAHKNGCISPTMFSYLPWNPSLPAGHLESDMMEATPTTVPHGIPHGIMRRSQHSNPHVPEQPSFPWMTPSSTVDFPSNHSSGLQTFDHHHGLPGSTTCVADASEMSSMSSTPCHPFNLNVNYSLNSNSLPSSSFLNASVSSVKSAPGYQSGSHPQDQIQEMNRTITHLGDPSGGGSGDITARQLRQVSSPPAFVRSWQSPVFTEKDGREAGGAMSGRDDQTNYHQKEVKGGDEPEDLVFTGNSQSFTQPAGIYSAAGYSEVPPSSQSSLCKSATPVIGDGSFGSSSIFRSSTSTNDTMTNEATQQQSAVPGCQPVASREEQHGAGAIRSSTTDPMAFPETLRADVGMHLRNSLANEWRQNVYFYNPLASPLQQASTTGFLSVSSPLVIPTQPQFNGLISLENLCSPTVAPSAPAVPTDLMAGSDTMLPNARESSSTTPHVAWVQMLPQAATQLNGLETATGSPSSPLFAFVNAGTPGPQTFTLASPPSFGSLNYIHPNASPGALRPRTTSGSAVFIPWVARRADRLDSVDLGGAAITHAGPFSPTVSPESAPGNLPRGSFDYGNRSLGDCQFSGLAFGSPLFVQTTGPYPSPASSLIPQRSAGSQREISPMQPSSEVTQRMEPDGTADWTMTASDQALPNSTGESDAHKSNKVHQQDTNTEIYGFGSPSNLEAFRSSSTSFWTDYR